jgi:hypothetical protein
MFLISLTLSQFQAICFVLKALNQLGIIKSWHANMCIIIGAQPHILLLFWKTCIMGCDQGNNIKTGGGRLWVPWYCKLMAWGYLAAVLLQGNYTMHGPIFQMATSPTTPNLPLKSTSKILMPNHKRRNWLCG